MSICCILRINVPELLGKNIMFVGLNSTTGRQVIKRSILFRFHCWNGKQTQSPTISLEVMSSEIVLKQIRFLRSFFFATFGLFHLKISHMIRKATIAIFSNSAWILFSSKILVEFSSVKLFFSCTLRDKIHGFTNQIYRNHKFLFETTNQTFVQQQLCSTSDRYFHAYPRANTDESFVEQLHPFLRHNLDISYQFDNHNDPNLRAPHIDTARIYHRFV